jgi:hypothetical protein
MRIYYKETNGNNLLFVTDGITVKTFYEVFAGLDLYTENIVEQLHKIITELIENDMLLSFNEIQGEDEWDDPFINDLTADCKLIIDTKEYKK